MRQPTLGGLSCQSQVVVLRQELLANYVSPSSRRKPPLRSPPFVWWSPALFHLCSWFFLTAQLGSCVVQGRGIAPRLQLFPATDYASIFETQPSGRPTSP